MAKGLYCAIWPKILCKGAAHARAPCDITYSESLKFLLPEGEFFRLRYASLVESSSKTSSFVCKKTVATNPLNVNKYVHMRSVARMSLHC